MIINYIKNNKKKIIFIIFLCVVILIIYLSSKKTINMDNVYTKNDVEFIPNILTIDYFMNNNNNNIDLSYNTIKPSFINNNIDKFGAADPFIVGDWIFCELWDKKGYIGVSKIQEVLDFKPVLIEDYHLSFPSVFKYNNEWFMIPESYQDNHIKLYKSTSFPYKWDFVKNIFDLDAIDSMVFNFKNKWYIFTTSQSNNKTYILQTDNFPSGPWTLHKENLLNGKRGGGTIFTWNNQLIFPIQPSDTQEYYCQNLELYTMNDNFEFSKLKEITASNGTKGIHHFAKDPFSNKCAIDFC